MRRGNRFVGAVLLMLALVNPGCLCRNEAPEPPKPLLTPLCLQAGPNLNWYNGSAHTLYVRVFQLTTPDAFVEMDPSKLVDRNVVVNGAVGPVMEKTVFPGTKVSLEIRQQEDAVHAGVVTFYYNATGVVKVVRRLPQRGDDPTDVEQPCIVLGSNGIESK